MKALQQGELDCLCGIYSIVNAVYFVSNRKIKRKPLFNELLLAYMNNWGVYDLLTNGLDIYQMEYLLNHISKLYKKIKIQPNEIKRRSTLKSNIITHLQSPNAGVLFSTYSHWSVINNYTDEELILFDSCSIKSINISEILPTSVFFISFNS
ncbi:hypothetical protein BKK54_08360 [Rodentibacter genomosp. 1]|uniref:Peptidase C39 domain-containing protein n=1 Tax=Rodentibacter genomosp. 1 TaxID=1908264 RepID=A0A1V3J3T6_9PAST|nr:hypothetical protein [Rodentibacter genomosp. 1]OOF49683.1 hypothetical protein BKK54_08360 [Rodentibacter genomosp. 1]